MHKGHQGPESTEKTETIPQLVDLQIEVDTTRQN